jgi:hypothetical protein
MIVSLEFDIDEDNNDVPATAHRPTSRPYPLPRDPAVSEQMYLSRTTKVASRQDSPAFHAAMADVLHGVAHIRDESANSSEEEEENSEGAGRCLLV